MDNTQWDYLYLVGYGGILATGWLLAHDPLDDARAALGCVAVIGAVAGGAAAVLDAIEDVGLFRMLGTPDAADLGIAPFATFVVSALKWALVIPSAALLPGAGLIAIVLSCST